jgi:catechol 2,3-dioxygenase-like lactoylglutathione lyase family enzyme
MSVIAIDHVQIAAPPGCEDAARGFYGELLGLTEVTKPLPLAARGGVWFAVGAQQLHIGVQEDHVPARKAHPGFRTADRLALDQLAATLSAAGHEPRWDDELPGTARFFVPDPWGNRIEILAAV